MSGGNLQLLHLCCTALAMPSTVVQAKVPKIPAAEHLIEIDEPLQCCLICGEGWFTVCCRIGCESEA